MSARQVVQLSSEDEARPFSPVENEAPLRWQRALHLAPRAGQGAVRRAVFFALLAWLPIAFWTLMHGHFLASAIGEPLLQHYGVQVRCLVVIPLLILGEVTLHTFGLRYFSQFISSGLVDNATRPHFDAALRTAARWRDSSLPWLFVVGTALAWTLTDRTAIRTDAMSWACDETGALGFGGVWFAYVVRPLYLGLLLGWLWRIVLLTLLFWRLGPLGLSLVPSHPDRAGGLAFLKTLPYAFAPVSFALSAMLSARWAHQIVHHGQRLQTFQVPAATFVVAWSLLLLLPLAALMPAMRKAKRAALPAYAAMVAEQGRLVRRRWIDGTKLDSPLLEPEGVGPIADAATMFNAVQSMRLFPIGKVSLLGIGLPVAMPMLAIVALEMPIRDLLLGLVKALM